VDASVVAVGLTPSGQMEVPDFGLAGWYTEGPVPGDPGPGVVIAHVSSRRGPDVFARLAELRPGDLVTVRATDGVERSWAVVATEQADKDDLPTGRIWNGTTQAVLRLITCAGSIDPDTGHYEDNWIVYADPVATDV
jgi:sortase (surface protein transpeptidase)